MKSLLNTPRGFLKYIIIIITLLFLTYSVINIGFYYTNKNTLFDKSSKLWAHGCNSIDKILKAHKLGFDNIEIDIVYSQKFNKYVISHDVIDFKINKILTLEEVFKHILHKGLFWLDLKNKNIFYGGKNKKAIARMNYILKKYNLKNKVIIESSNHNNLKPFTKEGIFTSYWISPYIKNRGLRLWYLSNKYKLYYLLGYYSSMSMDKKYFTSKFAKSFSQMQLNLFTVNNQKTIKEYSQISNVKIILTDI